MMPTSEQNEAGGDFNAYYKREYYVQQILDKQQGKTRTARNFIRTERFVINCH